VPSCKLLTSIAKSHKNSGVSALLQNTGAEPCIVTQPAQGILQNTATKRTTSSNTATGNRSRSSSRQRARETRQGPSTARLPSSHAAKSNSSAQPNQTARNLGPTACHATARTKPSPKRRSTRGVGNKRSETKLKNDTENWRGKRAPAGPDPEGGRAHPRRSRRKGGRPREKK
jgi:hypothetical protein